MATTSHGTSGSGASGASGTNTSTGTGSTTSRKRPPSKDTPLRLEKILGLTTFSNAALTSNTKGDLFYAAGSVAVLYNADDNDQRSFYHHRDASDGAGTGSTPSAAGGLNHQYNRAVSCQTVSPCNGFLAIGERGHQPAITVWSVDRHEKLATLNGHKHGVGCLAFSANGRYLVSVGFKPDKQCIVWAWQTSNTPVTILKLNNKVHCVKFSYLSSVDSPYLSFVTCGDRHLKWWTLELDSDGEYVDCVGKPASITEDQRNAIFMDCCFSIPTTGDSTHLYTVTFSGMLCKFSNTSRMMDNWVQLESPSAYALSLVAFNASIPMLSMGTGFSDNANDGGSSNRCGLSPGAIGMLFVGCADGIVRAFNPDSLDYLATLPLPCALPDDGISNLTYPACYALSRVTASANSPVPKLAAVYADHSMFVWDIADVYHPAVHGSFLYHHGCVWDVQFVEGDQKTTSIGGANQELSGELPSLPPKSFVTCSSDNTLRVWNTAGSAQRRSKWRTPFSRDMLHSIDVIPPLPFSSSSSAVSEHSVSTSSSSQQSIPISSRPVVSLAHGFPDLELPDKQQIHNAPRALSIEASLGHLAVGDKSGRLRVYDLRTMEEIVSVQAHSAEILTLNYSPPMKCSTVSDDLGSGATTTVWTAVDGSEHSSSRSDHLVLLATAGRDRLIHVFEAYRDTSSDSSIRYRIIHTLDHHSSSVTTVRFTSDGQRLLSCGGDRTIVFCRVNGPEITRIKSVQAPHGTVNGLAVETTNKFAVTSGQDKRVHIWNVHSGKLMRAYKSEHVTGELYKSDVDPSGIYVSSCAFDKTINIFDFFSGDLIAQTYGHSELVTGVRFSPDGRHLLSIGGDGCVMMWRVGDALVAAMQDRLMELYSTAQRKQTKATNAILLRQSQRLVLPQPPPPPQVLPPHYQEPTVVPAAATTPNLNTPISAMPPQPPGNGGQNRWASRVVQESTDGEASYEIFGRKVVVGALANPERNKFTLELSDTAAASVGLVDRGLASTVEADDVVCSGLSDSEDEEDEDKLFATADDEASSVLSGAGVVDDDNLHSARSRVDSLEKSAQNLENWLETMLRDESQLDATAAQPIAALDDSEPVSATSAPVDTQSHESASSKVTASTDFLGRSISSQFFNKLRKSMDTAVVIGKDHSIMRSIDQAQQEQQQLLNAAGSVIPSALAAAPAEGIALEVKRRETAAAVAQMKERLKSMGILESTIAVASQPSRSRPNNTATDNKIESSHHMGLGGMPPMPPSRVQEYAVDKTGAEATTTGVHRLATVVNSPARLPPIKEECAAGTTAALQDNEERLKQVANKCRASLSALDKAKAAAVASFQEFMALQSDVNKSLASLPTSGSASAANSSIDPTLPALHMEESVVMQRAIMRESELILREFRRSFESLNEHSHLLLRSISMDNSVPNTNSTTNGLLTVTGSGSLLSNSNLNNSQMGGGLDLGVVGASTMFNSSSSAANLDVSILLEKYSDKLMDLVAEKVAKRLNK